MDRAVPPVLQDFDQRKMQTCWRPADVGRRMGAEGRSSERFRAQPQQYASSVAPEPSLKDCVVVSPENALLGSRPHRQEQPTRTPGPSRVVSVQNIADGAQEADLLDALGQFGPISFVDITGRGTALVEFEEIISAERCIYCTVFQNRDIMVKNVPLRVSFANTNVIPRRGMESDTPSNVLVAYIRDPRYHISTEAIWRICQPIAPLSRVMIKQGSVVQALMEFATIEMADQVKRCLNGRDIYSGCCNLKIEFAKLRHLDVDSNDPNQADFTIEPVTNNGDPVRQNAARDMEIGHFDDWAMARNPPLMDDMRNRDCFSPKLSPQDEPPFEVRDRPAERYPINADQEDADMYRRSPPFEEFPPPFEEDMNFGQDVRGDYMLARSPPPPPRRSSRGDMNVGRFDRDRSPIRPFDEQEPYYGAKLHRSERRREHSTEDRFSEYHSDRMDRADRETGPRALMLYGLSPKAVNCHQVFNLLCLYGNVNKIMFLMNKNETCMVEMGDRVGARRVMEFLDGAWIMGKMLHVVPSRQNELNAHRGCLRLRDGSLAFEDFSKSPLQRFVSPRLAGKNRIVKPQPFLYFFNAPPEATERTLRDKMAKRGCPEPVNITIFNKKVEFVKHVAGIMEFENAADSSVTLMRCNHMVMEGSGRIAYTLKFCFACPANQYGDDFVQDCQPSGSSDSYGRHSASGNSRRYDESRPDSMSRRHELRPAAKRMRSHR